MVLKSYRILRNITKSSKNILIKKWNLKLIQGKSHIKWLRLEVAGLLVKKMITDVLLILPLYVILFVRQFRHVITMMADVGNILNNMVLLIHQKRVLSNIENKNV